MTGADARSRLPRQRRTAVDAVIDAVIGLEHVLGVHARARANARQALARDQARTRAHAAVAGLLLPVPRRPLHDQDRVDA